MSSPSKMYSSPKYVNIFANLSAFELLSRSLCHYLWCLGVSSNYFPFRLQSISNKSPDVLQCTLLPTYFKIYPITAELSSLFHAALFLTIYFWEAGMPSQSGEARKFSSTLSITFFLPSLFSFSPLHHHFSPS